MATMFPHSSPPVILPDFEGVFEDGPGCDLKHLAKGYGGLPAAFHPAKAVIRRHRVPLFFGREHPTIPWPDFSVGAGMVRIFRLIGLYWDQPRIESPDMRTINIYFSMRLPDRDTGKLIPIEAGRSHAQYVVDGKIGGGWADFLSRELSDVMIHEVNESLIVDGEFAVDPHPEGM